MCRVTQAEMQVSISPFFSYGEYFLHVSELQWYNTPWFSLEGTERRIQEEQTQLQIIVWYPYIDDNYAIRARLCS